MSLPREHHGRDTLLHQRTHQIHHICNDARRRVIRHHIAVVVAILISRRRWRHPRPVRARHRTDVIRVRNHIPRNKRWTPATTPAHGIRTIVLQELVAAPRIKLEVRTTRLRTNLWRPLILRWTPTILRRPLTTRTSATTLLRRAIPTLLRRLLTTTLRRPLPALLWRTLTATLRRTLPSTALLWRPLSTARTTLPRLRLDTSGCHGNCSQQHRSREQLVARTVHVTLPLCWEHKPCTTQSGDPPLGQP